MMSESNYIPIGEYPFYDLKKVTDKLEELSIDYEVDLDDTRINNISPLQASYGGTGGLGAVGSVSVDPNKIDESNKILLELFPV
jgi:hypothetical protein